VSEADRLKWDERYAAGSYAERRHPTALLADWLAALPRGRALDVACGAGRNALFLAAHGFEVDAIDISATGLEQARGKAREAGLEIHWHEADLDRGAVALPEHRYDLIVVVRYIDSELMPTLIDRLEDGGYLVCEQHLRTHAPVAGPSSPAYRLRPNALLGTRGPLRLLFYREGIVTDPDRRDVALAQMVAVRGQPVFDRTPTPTA
jgi:tellurite methyltransferase